MATIYQYEKQITAGANGTVIDFVRSEGDTQPMELCTINGTTYLSVPDGYVIPTQPVDISFAPVVMTEDLRETIKTNSRAVQLITEEVQKLIRNKYSLEDEQYFSRIGVGAALGAYTFLTGEQEALLAFGNYVEECRQYGKTKRAELGL